MGDPFIRHIALLGFEKRFVPSQHYVYIFLVKWQDLSEKVVYRRFTEIYEFHKILKEMFPIEAGDINPENRIIPHLPGCRGQTDSDAPASAYRALNARRVKRPETYLVPRDGKSSIADITGPIILQTYRAIADYEKTSGTEMALDSGDVVDVVEKSESGWWFCQMKTKRGWVPASYLEPLDSPDEAEDPEPNYAGEPYVAIKAYTAALEDEVSLEEGEAIEVIHKLLDGWWVIRSSIRNAHSIHQRSRKRLSQDTYRRNSVRFLQQRRRLARPGPPGAVEEPPQTRRAKPQPAVPPRPSADLILNRCSESTKRKLASAV
ncbi:hypothetical protein HPG69_003498 [Diceros bicornis minor]|uniref:SH3 domain-containing protein n=1 Tax=Diceros bicornis minor TaxID=77932 RepID=A0A7J7FA34_DICBM|nr:hypothetical protein HPG69_003498 [Diceros bicornis minor]